MNNLYEELTLKFDWFPCYSLVTLNLIGQIFKVYQTCFS